MQDFNRLELDAVSPHHLQVSQDDDRAIYGITSNATLRWMELLAMYGMMKVGLIFVQSVCTVELNASSRERKQSICEEKDLGTYLHQG